MSIIHVLDEQTINQIAAGEVVERPSAVVKELIENAMDAGATAITAEIKEGGLSLIRITDNGSGIAREDIPLAFMRHATSKIKTAEDLLSVTSLGFRGEALSSIAAVAQVELITKAPSSLHGYRYIIEGGEEKSLEEIGCPGGTTILVRNIFYNTPARRKFLKSAMTETGYVSDLMERLMTSHPNISFKFIVNNQVKLQSSGNNNTKDILYQIYGRDVSKELLPVEYTSPEVSVRGFIGKPIINRGNRNFENYFINGRYIKSNVITKAIEEAYKPFLMQHKYPFTSLYFEIDPSLIDVNVHPQKLEVRLKNGEEIYQTTMNLIRSALSGKELIPKVTLHKQEESKNSSYRMPEPFEEKRREQQFTALKTMSPEKLSEEQAQVLFHNSSTFQGNKYASPGAYVREGTSYHVPKEHVGTVTPIHNNLSSTAVEASINDSDRSDIVAVDHPQREPFVQSQERKQLDQHGSSPGNGPVDQPNLLHGNGPVDQHSLLHGNEQVEQHGLLQGNGSVDLINPLQKTEQGDQLSALQETGQERDLSTLQESENEKQLNSFQKTEQAEQLSLFQETQQEEQALFLSEKGLHGHRIIGQVFSTFWLVEYQKELYIIDQHAAHEKVLYERIMEAAKSKGNEAQQLYPPIVLTLTLREQEVLHQYEEVLTQLGYEFEYFGGNEFSVRAVPADLYGLSEKELILEFLDTMAEELSGSNMNVTSILEKTASLSCKAAVKANHSLSTAEASALIKELLTLDNPYHCPHGRPVIISMSRYELEKKFKRIV